MWENSLTSVWRNQADLVIKELWQINKDDRENIILKLRLSTLKDWNV